jgi:hypothetical protein
VRFPVAARQPGSCARRSRARSPGTAPRSPTPGASRPPPAASAAERSGRGEQPRVVRDDPGDAHRAQLSMRTASSTVQT